MSEATLTASEGQAAFADAPNFATCGATAALVRIEAAPGPAAAAVPAP